MNTHEKPHKPLGKKAYGSIPHLPGSRRGPADKGLSEQQASLLTVKTRDRHDHVVVQEKLDGSCVAVVRIGDEIIPLTRTGYRAETSKFETHQVFHRWAMKNQDRFLSLLNPSERVCGEWLHMAHGTIYKLWHEPFVPFDIMVEDERSTFASVAYRAAACGFITPKVLSEGPPVSIEAAMKEVEPSHHGAVGLCEGAVWRMERKGVVEFLGKYVRPDKVDGKYFHGEPVYNWISDV